MKIEHLQYFREVAAAGSINKAAERLALAQPYLSALLRDLERDLGVTLLERHNWGVRPTPAGEECLLLAARIGEAYGELRALAEQYGQPRTQPLTVANLYAFTLLDLFQEFAAQHRAEQELLSYLEMPPTEILDCVAQGRATLGFTVCGAAWRERFELALAERNLRFEPLIQEPFYIILSKAHPLFAEPVLHSAQLLAYTLVVDKSKREFHRANFAPWYEQGRVSPVLFDNNRSAMYYLTKVGHCFSVGQKSLNLTNPFVSSGELRYIPWRESPYLLTTGYVVRRGEALPSLAEDFCALVRHYFTTNNVQADIALIEKSS